MNKFPERTLKRRTDYAKVAEEKEKKKQQAQFESEVDEAEVERYAEQYKAAFEAPIPSKSSKLQDLRDAVLELQKRGVPEGAIEQRIGKENYRRLMHPTVPQPVDHLDTILSSGPRFPTRESIDVTKLVKPKKPKVKATVAEGHRKRLKEVDELD
jgi:hypothetical protein